MFHERRRRGRLCQERHPQRWPLHIDMGVNVMIEATGRYREHET